MAVILSAGDYGLNDILEDGEALMIQAAQLKTDAEAAQLQTAQNKSAALTAAQNAQNWANAAALLLAASGGSGGGASAGVTIRQVNLTNVPNNHTFLHGGNNTRFRARFLVGGVEDPLVSVVPLMDGNGVIDPLRARLTGPANEFQTGVVEFVFETATT